MDPRRFEITFACSTTYEDTGDEDLLAEGQMNLVFDHLVSEDGPVQQCVFKESVATTVAADARQRAITRPALEAKEYRSSWYTTAGGSGGTGVDDGDSSVPPWVIRLGPPQLGEKSKTEQETEAENLEAILRRARSRQQLDSSTILNDTELPNLVFDLTRWQISFDWIGMFSKFFAEAAALAKLDAKAHDLAKETMEAPGPTTTNDQNDLELDDSLSGNVVQRHNNRRQIRRQRIRRFYKARGSSRWREKLRSRDERWALGMLDPDFPKEWIGMSLCTD